MNKKIVHQLIPLNEHGWPNVSPETVNIFCKINQELLGDDYVVIASPFETNAIDKDEKIIHIDCKAYSYNELMEIIEKESIYDGLSN